MYLPNRLAKGVLLCGCRSLKMYWKGEYVGGCLSVVLRASLYICTTAVLYRISFSYFLQKGPKEITVESWTYNNDASAFFI